MIKMMLKVCLDFLLAANIVKSKDNEIPQTYYMIK